MSRPQWLPIGAVVRAHGVRGVVRVRLFDPGSRSLSAVDRVFVGDARRAFAVETAAPADDAYLLKLAGIDDRDGAEALRGETVQLQREQLPEPDDDELYLSDLVGCALVDGAGALLGTVTATDNASAQTLLVISLVADASTGQVGKVEARVPFVEPLIVSVDLSARRIVCDLPEGLLEVQR